MPRTENHQPHDDDGLAGSDRKYLACVPVLWATAPFWTVRKNMVFDFSKSSPQEYEIRTTVDMDWPRACHILGQSQQVEFLIIPIEMPAKTFTISMDVSVDGEPAHVLRKSYNQIIGATILLPLIADALPPDAPVPQCLYAISCKLVCISASSLAHKNKSDGSMRAWIQNFATEEMHKQICNDKECQGLAKLRSVVESQSRLAALEAFTERYIRSVIVPRPSQPIVIIKTSEVTEEDPFATDRRSKPAALWGSIDFTNMTIRHKITIRYPADIDMLKCIPPDQAYFALAESTKDPAGQEKGTDALDVHPNGAWAYKKLPSESNGSMTEFRSAAVDIIARRAPLIFPGLVMSILGFLSQLYILLHIATGTTQPRDIVANPIVSAVTIALPVGAATYISISRHALIVRYLTVYRNWLLSALLTQIATTAVASLDKSRSLLFVGIGFCSSLLVLIVFIDATAQGNPEYYQSRVRFFKKLREHPVLWSRFFLLWLAESIGIMIALSVYRESSVQPNIEYLTIDSSDIAILLLLPCACLTLLPIGVSTGNNDPKWWPILLGLYSISWVSWLVLREQYPNGWFFASILLLLSLYIVLTWLTLYGASYAFHATLCPRCAKADTGRCYLE